jgi:hypothetical protein
MDRMREIKFRGYTRQEDKNKWVYGSLVVYKSSNVQIVTPSISYFVDQKSVGQFTGCYDGGGNEIYEGDILGGICVHGSIADAVVVFKDGRFSVEQNTGEKYADDVCYYAAYMIIGNKFENPEMMERD